MKLIEGNLIALERLHHVEGKPLHAAHAVLKNVFDNKMPREALENSEVLALLKRVPPESVIKCHTNPPSFEGTPILGHKCPLICNDPEDGSFWIIFFPKANSPGEITDELLFPLLN